VSGGYFDYKQHHISDIANEIRGLIELRGGEFEQETLTWFEQAEACLRMAAVYAQRIDWLVSGDDSEETFRERLPEELGKSVLEAHGLNIVMEEKDER